MKPFGKNTEGEGAQPQPLMVIHVMTPGVIQIPGDVSVGEAARLMHREQVPCLLIKDTEAKVGIVTHSDIVYKVVAQGLNPNDIEARRVMSRPVRSIEYDQPLDDVTQVLYSSEIPFLIVTRKNLPVGVLTPQDLLATAKYQPSQLDATIKVYSETPEGTSHSALITQLSHRGAFIECATPMLTGSRVTLEFSIPDSPLPLTVEATVLDQSDKHLSSLSPPTRPAGGIPLEFHDLSLASQTAISAWVTALKNKKNRNA